MQRIGEEQVFLSTNPRFAVATLTGTTFALLSASLICRPPDPSHSSGVRLLLTAVGYSLLVAIAGFVGLWLSLPYGRHKAAVRVSRFFLSGWLFLPAAVLLMREYSLLALVPAMLAGIALSLAWIRAFPETYLDATASPATNRAELFTALPPQSLHLGTGLLASTLLYSTAIALLSGWLSLAGYLVTLAAFVLTRPLAGPAFDADHVDVGQPSRSQRKTPFVFLSTMAVLMTVIALLPTLRAENVARDLAALQLWMASMRIDRPPQAVLHDKATNSSGYIGIVLWPPPKKKLKASVALYKAVINTPATSRPMVIPFDGPYLYTKVAGDLPGPLSHVAHGTPTSLKGSK